MFIKLNKEGTQKGDMSEQGLFDGLMDAQTAAHKTVESKFKVAPTEDSKFKVPVLGPEYTLEEMQETIEGHIASSTDKIRIREFKLRLKLIKKMIRDRESRNKRLEAMRLEWGSQRESVV